MKSKEPRAQYMTYLKIHRQVLNFLDLISLSPLGYNPIFFVETAKMSRICRTPSTGSSQARHCIANCFGYHCRHRITEVQSRPIYRMTFSLQSSLPHVIHPTASTMKLQLSVATLSYAALALAAGNGPYDAVHPPPNSLPFHANDQ